MKAFSALDKIRKSRIFQLLPNLRIELMVLVLVSSLINILMLTPTVYMLQVFDRVMQSQNEITLLVLTAIVVILYAIQGISDAFRSRLLIGIGLKIDLALRDPIFQSIFKNTNSRQDTVPTQGLTDLLTLRQLITGPIVFAFFDLPWTPIYLGVMFLLHPLLGWLTISFMLVLFFLAFWSRASYEKFREIKEQDEVELNSFLHSKLNNADIITTLGMVPSISARWWERQIRFLANENESQDTSDKFSVVSKELRIFMQSLALAAGALLAMEGEITVGAMIAASLLVARATSPIDQIVSGWTSLEGFKHAAVRLESLLERSTSLSPLQSWSRAPGIDVNLRNVSASAGQPKRKILECVNLNFSPHTVSLIVGGAGAGKSTLGKVILGLWPSDGGEVTLNRLNIHDIDRTSLGPDIGYVPQDSQLFKGTIAENIARMSPVDSDEVLMACKLCGVDRMILNMPQGYDTLVGVDGKTLSGGQRQRIALARAFLGSPRLLILDEPDASLDEEGLKALSAAILTMRTSGATVIVITHKEDLFPVADRVITMAGGRVTRITNVDEHKELLQNTKHQSL